MASSNINKKEIDYLVAIKEENHQIMYLVKWANCAANENCWIAESEINLAGTTPITPYTNPIANQIPKFTFRNDNINDNNDKNQQ